MLGFLLEDSTYAKGFSDVPCSSKWELGGQKQSWKKREGRIGYFWRHTKNKKWVAAFFALLKPFLVFRKVAYFGASGKPQGSSGQPGDAKNHVEIEVKPPQTSFILGCCSVVWKTYLFSPSSLSKL